MENKKLTENPNVMELSDDVLDQVTGGTGITLEKASGTTQVSTGDGPVKIIVPDDPATQTKTQIAAENLLRSFEAQMESHSNSFNEIGGNVNVGIKFDVPTGQKPNPYFVYYEADNGSAEKFSTNVP